MGYRGHARVVNKIEYGSGVGNHNYNEFRELLSLCGGSEYCIEEGSESWELNRNSLADGIHWLKNADEEAKEEIADIIKYSGDEFKNVEEFISYAIECFQTWLDEGDPEHEWIHVDWF